MHAETVHEHHQHAGITCHIGPGRDQKGPTVIQTEVRLIVQTRWKIVILARINAIVPVLLPIVSALQMIGHSQRTVHIVLVLLRHEIDIEVDPSHIPRSQTFILIHVLNLL